MNKKEVLNLSGMTDDLLMVNKDNTMKCTRLILLDPNSKEIDEEVVDVCITSTNALGKHPLFDSLLGKHIRIIVEVSDLFIN